MQSGSSLNDISHDQADALQQMMASILEKPETAYKSLESIDELAQANSSLWIIWIIALKDQVKELIRSHIVEKAQISIAVTQKLIEACYGRYQLGTNPNDTSLLVHLTSTILSNLPFTLYSDELQPKENINQRLAFMKAYEGFLSTLQTMAQNSPRFFLQSGHSSVCKSPSLDIILVLLCFLNFIVRKLPLGFSLPTTPEFCQLMGCCERLEAQLITTLCNANPLLTLRPLAYMSSFISKIFMDSSADSVSIVSAYKVRI